MNVEQRNELAWDKPGPGSWRYDGAHNDGPKAQFLQAMFPAAMEAGFKSFTARYGLPLSHIEVRFVNGYAYDTPRIAGVPANDRPPPPPTLLRILTRIHPEFRRRERNARAAFDSAEWRRDLDRWESVLRPARVAANRALQATDVESLSDEALAEHLEAAVANADAGLREHFGLIGASAIPVGLHVVRSGSAKAAFAQLRGAAATSTGATMPALSTIARELQVAGVRPSTLHEVRNASPAAAAQLDAYLDEYGQRIISTYDVTGKRLIEMPDVVLRSIAAAGAEAAPRCDVDDSEDGQDELLDDARRAFASRDDHAGVSGTWPMGLVRRALLAAADRLVTAGRLDDREHVFDCTPDEVAAMLRGATSPDASVIADRARARARAASTRPPSQLGVDLPPPDASVFPSAMRRMAEAMFAAFRMLETSKTDGADGEGIGDRVHRGRAVVAHRAADAIERLEPGDVLVTSMTTPAFNCVLPVVGALVTMHGGQFSHAGIVARELGIPTVLGVPDVLDRIPDGAIVDVDPVAGTVRVITV